MTKIFSDLYSEERKYKKKKKTGYNISESLAVFKYINNNDNTKCHGLDPNSNDDIIRIMRGVYKIMTALKISLLSKTENEFT